MRSARRWGMAGVCTVSEAPSHPCFSHWEMAVSRLLHLPHTQQQQHACMQLLRLLTTVYTYYSRRYQVHRGTCTDVVMCVIGARGARRIAARAQCPACAQKGVGVVGARGRLLGSREGSSEALLATPNQFRSHLRGGY